MLNSIQVYDWQAILSLIQSVAWVAVLGIGMKFLIQAKLIAKQNKQIIVLVFAAWAVASLSLAGVNAYSYFNSQRAVLVESIDAQRHQQYGL